MTAKSSSILRSGWTGQATSWSAYKASEDSTLGTQREYLKALLAACLTEHVESRPRAPENFSNKLKDLPQISEAAVGRQLGQMRTYVMEELDGARQDKVLAYLGQTIPDIAQVMANRLGKRIDYSLIMPTSAPVPAPR